MFRRLRIAFRILVKTPAVTTVAVLSLALGIGGTVAIFSLFNEFILRSLPVSDPGGLVNFVAPGPKAGATSCNNQGGCDEIFSYPMFRDLERQQTAFTGIAAHRVFNTNLAYKGQTLNGLGMKVSGSYFQILGIRPALGRLIEPEDDRTIGKEAVVVLSHDYWQSRFDGSPAVLNETLIVNGQPLTIVGVASRGFHGTSVGTRPHVFIPITLRRISFEGFDERKTYWAYLFGRLKPGVSIAQAQTAINVAYSGILNEVEAPLQTMSEQTLKRFRSKQLILEPGYRGQSSLHEETRTGFLVMLGVTTFVLLIACINVANLLLARSAARAGEMAVRLSVGASRRQLITQLLTESCLLALAGGLAGLIVARWTLGAVISMLPADALSQMDLDLNQGAMVFAAALTLGTGLLFGLFPALHSTRPDVMATLKGQSGTTTDGRAASRFRTVLVTGQIALSMALLIAAGLFLRSLNNTLRVDLGFDPGRLGLFSISPELNGYSDEQSRALFVRVEEELAALPGVASASASMVPLLSGSNWGTSVSVQGFERGPDTDAGAQMNVIGPGYFRTLGIPLIAGREFTESDAGNESPKVAIVNEAFARKFNLGREAVGKRMAWGNANVLDIEIVGLVQDSRYAEIQDAAPPQLFTPYRQDPPGSMTFYIRTTLDPAQVLQSVRPLIRRLDANLPVEATLTMRQQIEESLIPDRIIGRLSAAFALLATLLAAVGLYGVLAYSVSQRTKEIGLRVALGAEPSHVRRMVLRQTVLMLSVGTVIGLAIGIGFGRLAESLLFELKGYDPAVLVIAAALLILVALAASALPAYRASRIDPMKALRYE